MVRGKSIFYALGANSSIAVAKFIAAIITGSGAMMAEAIHSVADSSNQLLLLLGLKQAKKPPSADYPLGHGKEVYFWSFVVAIILFSICGLFSIYEGIHKLRDPHELTSPYIAIAVLLFAIVAEGISLLACIKEINKERHDRTFRQWFKDTRQGALLVVFGEDSAALMGLVFALVAILLSMLTGNPAYDAVGSIGIGVLLVVVAVFIGYEVKALLVGQGVEAATKKKMFAFLQEREEIEEIYNLLTLQLGNDVMVAVKAKMTAMDSDRAIIRVINRTESAMRQAFPEILWLFFEPDTYD